MKKQFLLIFKQPYSHRNESTLFNTMKKRNRSKRKNSEAQILKVETITRTLQPSLKNIA